VTYVGTAPNPVLAADIARWATEARAAGGWQPASSSQTVTGAHSRDGRQLRFVHNWSWTPSEFVLPAAAAGVFGRGAAAPRQRSVLDRFGPSAVQGPGGCLGDGLRLEPRDVAQQVIRVGTEVPHNAGEPGNVRIGAPARLLVSLLFERCCGPAGGVLDATNVTLPSSPLRTIRAACRTIAYAE